MAEPAALLRHPPRARRSSHAHPAPPLNRSVRDALVELPPRVRGRGRGLVDWTRRNESSVVQLGLLGLTALGALALVLFRRLVFPPKFSYDSDTIHRLAVAGNPGHLIDDSFANVAAVYRLAGLENNETLAAVIGYGLALVAVAAVLWTRRFVMTPSGTVACALTVVFSAVYLGTYSKDVFVLPISLMLLLLAPGLKRELLIIVALLAYADVFRSYWYLVAGFYLLYRVIEAVCRPRWALLVAPFAVLIVAGIVFPVVFGHPSDFARVFSNQWRTGSPDAATMIHDVVTLPGPMGSIVNTAAVFVTLFLPVPLMLRGGAYYTVVTAAFVALWASFFLGWTRTRRGTVATAAVGLLMAFVTTQALFEPDYGSALRHLTPLLPLLCFVALAPRPGAAASEPRTVTIQIPIAVRRRARSRAVG